MNKLIIIALITLNLAASTKTTINDTFNYNEFTKAYFSAWVNTQSPDATKKDIEHYLSFLTDDVAYQHLPYRKNTARKKGGKDIMRKGMLQWLKANKTYKATLISTTIGKNIIVLKYEASMKIEENGKLVTLHKKTLDILEIENGKVSVIRKYR